MSVYLSFLSISILSDTNTLESAINPPTSRSPTRFSSIILTHNSRLVSDRSLENLDIEDVCRSNGRQ